MAKNRAKNVEKVPSSTSSLGQARAKSKLLPTVTAANDGQKDALRSIANPDNHIVLLNGIAGTGKTFVSASWGLEQLLKGHFERMILTRPYVEAGESLGFLPGTYDNKIAPFMIPIFDVFRDHLSDDDIDELFKSKKIITLPIAYMRGVTFKNAFVLLDEAQNTSIRQMHLFLTRVGQNAKLVVTGDSRQSDIKGENGFTDALARLQGINGLDMVHLDPKCVVRHAIIPEIEQRYTNGGPHSSAKE